MHDIDNIKNNDINNLLNKFMHMQVKVKSHEL
jgi:hypothetical protein